LLFTYFARGAFADAFAEGDTALSLNPLDPTVRGIYGVILVATGQLDRGEAFLKEIWAGPNLKPAWLSSHLFLVSYLKGDLITASHYANLDISNTAPLGMVARVLIAAKTGDRDREGQMIEQLVTVYPVFREDPRRALERAIPSAEILDRLTHDLAAVGLGLESSSVRQ